MKNLVIFFTVMISLHSFSQAYQNQAPWMEDLQLSKKSKNEEPKMLLDDIVKSAEAYFETIDKNKKGSGLKPYERWKYHWSFFTKPDGTIAPAEDLWSAWEQKNAMNKNQGKADQSNWTPLGPFQSFNTYSSSSRKSSGQGRVNAIAIDPSNSNTYYVGAPAGGIWKSTNAGIDWAPLTDYLPQIGVSGIAIHPTSSNIIYIATGDDDAGDSYSVGVWKSTDGGTTWNATGAMSGNPRSMNEIYINPNSPETILIATEEGVFKTNDGGSNWNKKIDGDFLDLKMKPTDPTTWYATTASKFYTSTDSGENFNEIVLPGLTNSGRLTMDVTIANNDYVYVVSAKNRAGSYAFNGIYKSVDSGTTFTKTAETSDIFKSSQAWYDLALTVSSGNPDIIYVGVLDIWKSTDGGNDFSKLTEWFSPDTASYTHADIHFMRFIDGKFFVGSDGGIYVSTDEGVNFTDLTEKLSISQFYKISVSPQNSSVIAGGLQDNGGFAFSNNTWTNYHGGDGMEGIVSPINENVHFGFTQFGGSIARTSNKGASQSLRVNKPAANGEWVTPMSANSKGEIFSGYAQLYKLNESGSGSWEKLSDHNFGGNIDNITINPFNDALIYLSQFDGLYRSTDEGKNFEKLTFDNGNIRSIEVSKINPDVAWVVANGGVYKTENLSASTPEFTNLSNNLPSESKLVVKHHERSGNNTIYLGTALGVYSYNDTSNAWEVFDNDLPNVTVRDLEIHENDSKIYAGTFGRGVFVSDIPKVLPPVDVRLVSIESPTGLVCSASGISPRITVINEGVNSLSSIVINYSLDDGLTESYTWNGNLDTNQSTEISIPEISTSFGVHTINIESTTSDDAFPSNNNASVSFNINTLSTSPTTVNSFETPEEELLVESIGSSFWEIAEPNKNLLNAASTGTKAYVSNASGNYPDNTIGYLYSNCYNLSQIVNPILSFQMGFDTEDDWDYMIFEYTTDLGENWSTLGTASDPNWYNSSTTVNGLPGAQWEGRGESENPNGGNNATLHEYTYNLASLNNQTSIIFRFKFITDANTNEEGAVIDDFVIKGTTLSTNDNVLIQSFIIYPNPSEDVFNLNWSSIGEAHVAVYDYLGKTIVEKKNISDQSYKLDLKKYAKGLYFVKLNVEGKQATKKIVLK